MYKKQSLQDARLYHVPHTHQPCSRSNRGNGNRWSHAKPSDLLRPPPPPNHAILILTHAFKTAIKENPIHILKGLSKQFLHQVDTNLEFFMYDHSALEACYQTANDIINSHSTTTADPPPPSFNNLVPVSNLPSLIHLPGVASQQISTPGCQPSWTGST